MNGLLSGSYYYLFITAIMLGLTSGLPAHVLQFIVSASQNLHALAFAPT
ncbi:hypothetical protein PPEP_a3870 [Pseudoalteromonas peptidolytica F12-50-A1]|uniref:Uncharacterized protein n=1 Tax=Pseudoalteromonas peptidolytica F12-50-A1 TaxID=1315280 RepID=A0A8I0MWW1_9GAMM|nr:hypothetical protein [Pseudoalteromonas peptidolytica F12-50-A1]